jgi:hypothetical protein
VKENSIEEDILNIEKYVELVIDKNYCDCNELNVICAGNHRDGSKNVAYSIQHILSDYKRVLKENEELKLYNNSITSELEQMTTEKFKNGWFHQSEFKGLIPVQKVQDIIDRIDYDIKKTKEIISKNTNIYASYRKNDYQIVRLRAMNTKSLDIKKRLQELLEGREENESN